MSVTVALLVLGVLACDGKTIDFCSQSCDGVRHTMCDYPPGGGDACEEFHGGLSAEDVRVALDLHNEMRQRIATRAEHPAGDMREMSWDPQAALVAQRWADQCGLLGHDRCRTVPGETHVGQSVCQVSGYDTLGSPTSQEAIRSCIMAWYQEEADYQGPLEDFDPEPEELARIGHYTQLAWATTDRVGCGLSRYSSGEEYQFRLVCNYLPGGNVMGRAVYSRGEPCSLCPSDTQCSRQWPVLCKGVGVGDVNPHTEAVHTDTDTGCVQTAHTGLFILLAGLIIFYYNTPLY